MDDVELLLTEERDEWKFVAHHRARLINAIFYTLNDWHDRATYLPPGKSGQIRWYVTRDDIAHLKEWAENIDELIRRGPLNLPHQFADATGHCEPR